MGFIGGSLLEFVRDGQYGQFVEYVGDLATVAKLSGELVQVDVSELREVTGLQTPGQGGDERSFDIILGPQTQRDALAEEIASCLTHKAFCVIKAIPDSRDEESLDVLTDVETQGQFARMSQEVEEGYLGKGCRAKTMWLDPEADLGSEFLSKVDANFTLLAELVQPLCQDACGASIADRTPSLVCMTMRDEENYELPAATDAELMEFYTTWKRCVLRLVHFLGPADGSASLMKKESCSAAKIKDFTLAASANTILVFREDVFEYRFQEPFDSDTCWMQTFLLRRGANFTFDSNIEGDLANLGGTQDGPPPPDSDQVAVMAIALHSAADMSDGGKEWAAYISGVDGQLEMPLTRFEYLPYYSEEVDAPQNTTYVKHFSVQEGIDQFDNKHFEISNGEASAMDPMHRQVLEVGCECLHDIGLTKKWCNTHPLHATVSVGNDKQEWCHMPDVPSSVAVNNQLAISANRFSYVFNLKGGNFVCDTACSSSLCATHLGKRNMMERRWDPIEWHLGMGTGLTLTVISFIMGSAAHMLSPQGRCLTFNATASGYNRGDGTGAIIIKPGTNEEDRIALFRGSEIGQDGRSASISAPNGPSQEKCSWGAIREARMTPPESTVWECHGTGTSLGDPIEVGAVRKVQIKMPRVEPLMVQTSKSNIGHLEGSAAIIAMVKCAMIVVHTKSPSTIHCRVLNPHLDHALFDAIFTTETTPFAFSRGHCQVSSFGVGGTNGHAIFWGEELHTERDWSTTFHRKFMNAHGKIIADGPDPEMWEYHGPPIEATADKYKVVIYPDKNYGDVVRWVKQDVEQPDFYSVTGNHNNWTADRMLMGDVKGLWFLEVDVPSSGELHFRILADGDSSKAFGPQQSGCTKKLAAILGPADITTHWTVRGVPKDVIRLEFLAIAPTVPKSICWRRL